MEPSALALSCVPGRELRHGSGARAAAGCGRRDLRRSAPRCPSRAAICRLVRPSPTRLATSCCRAVRASRRPPAARAQAEEAADGRHEGRRGSPTYGRCDRPGSTTSRASGDARGERLGLGEGEPRGRGRGARPASARARYSEEVADVERVAHPEQGAGGGGSRAGALVPADLRAREARRPRRREDVGEHVGAETPVRLDSPRRWSRTAGGDRSRRRAQPP